MRIPLAAKMVGFLVVTLLLAMTAAWYVSLSQEERVVEAELDDSARMLARAIDHGLSASMISEHKSEAREMVDDLVDDAPIRRIAIFGADGKPWYDTSGRGDPLLVATPESLVRVAATGERESAFDPQAGSELYEVLSPIKAKPECFRCHEQAEASGGHLGVVAVVLSTREARARQAADRRQRVLTDLLTIALVVVALGLALTFFVVRPILRLAGIAGEVAEGDLELRSGLSRNDEIGDLSEAFDDMTDQLEQEIRDLEAAHKELQGTIGRVGQAIGSAYRVEDLMDVLAREAARVGAHEAATILFFSEQDELLARGACGVEPDAVSEYNRRPLKRTDALVQQLMKGDITSKDFDPELEPDWARLAVLPGARHQCVIPISFESALLGVITLPSKTGCGLTEDSRALLHALSSQAALALEQIRLNEQAKLMAITDGLTGLYDHRYFQERLGVEIERATRFSRPLSIVMLDVDYFKELNDRDGHLVGDAMLEGLGGLLATTVRKIDIAARYGGDEVAIILMETGPIEAQAYAERLRAAVESATLAPGLKAPEGLTISLGVASFPEHGGTPERLVGAADEALYRAKAQGRNRVVTAGTEMGAV